jgi:Bacteriophage Mu-like, Gp48
MPPPAQLDSLLDDFGRPTALTLGPNWTVPVKSGDVSPQISLSTAFNNNLGESAPNFGRASAYWNPLSIVGDQAAAITYGTGEAAVWIKANGIGDAYSMSFHGTNVEINRWSGGANTILFSASQTMTNGDRLGLWMIGNELHAALKIGANPWAEFFSYTDSTPVTGTRIGMRLRGTLGGTVPGSRVDAFYGGYLGKQYTTPLTDAAVSIFGVSLIGKRGKMHALTDTALTLGITLLRGPIRTVNISQSVVTHGDAMTRRLNLRRTIPQIASAIRDIVDVPAITIRGAPPPPEVLSEEHALEVGQRMIDSLPPFLAYDPYVQMLMRIWGREVSRLWKRMLEEREKLFPQHADDEYLTLALWEMLLGLPVQTRGVSIDDRRALVITAIQNRNVSSGKRWMELVSAAVRQEGWTHKEGPQPYIVHIWLPIHETSIRLGQLKQLIRRFTPAHIDLDITSGHRFIVEVSHLEEDVL